MMVIKYKAARSDVWNAYWRSWRNSARLNLLRAVIFVAAFFIAWSHLTAWSLGPAGRVGGALAAAIAVMVLLPLYPMLLFKHEERTLTITPDGIVTTIGRRSGDVPWGKVSRIEPAERCIYIFGTSGNGFTIPDRAFASGSQRAEFLRQATGWWEEARRPAREAVS
jgi:YcxB-like protein